MYISFQINDSGEIINKKVTETITTKPETHTVSININDTDKIYAMTSMTDKSFLFLKNHIYVIKF